MNAPSITFALLAMVLYGAQHVLVKDGASAIADPLLVVLYAAVGGLLTAGALLLSSQRRSELLAIVSCRANWTILAVAVAAGALSATFYYIGLEKTPAPIVSAILNTSVLWGAVFAWAFHRQRPSSWFYPCLLLVLCGLAVQLRLFSAGAALEGSLHGLRVALLFLVPALYVLKPYLFDKQLANRDPVAAALAATVPYGLLALCGLLLVVSLAPERVAAAAARAPLGAHLSFLGGSGCVTLALAAFQKSIAAATKKAAPALFYGLVPSFTLLLGAGLHWAARTSGLAFAQRVQPTPAQVGGGLLVTAGLLAYAVLPRLLARSQGSTGRSGTA